MRSKARRTTSCGAFNYMGAQQNENGDFISPPSQFALYQAEMHDIYHKSKWFANYIKGLRSFPVKLKAFTRGVSIPMSELQSSLSMNYVFKNLFHIDDEKRKAKILTLIFIRNLLRL